MNLPRMRECARNIHSSVARSETRDQLTIADFCSFAYSLCVRLSGVGHYVGRSEGGRVGNKLFPRWVNGAIWPMAIDQMVKAGHNALLPSDYAGVRTLPVTLSAYLLGNSPLSCFVAPLRALAGSAPQYKTRAPGAVGIGCERSPKHSNFTGAARAFRLAPGHRPFALAVARFVRFAHSKGRCPGARRNSSLWDSGADSRRAGARRESFARWGVLTPLATGAMSAWARPVLLSSCRTLTLTFDTGVSAHNLALGRGDCLHAKRVSDSGARLKTTRFVKQQRCLLAASARQQDSIFSMLNKFAVHIHAQGEHEPCHYFR